MERLWHVRTGAPQECHVRIEYFEGVIHLVHCNNNKITDTGASICQGMYKAARSARQTGGRNAIHFFEGKGKMGKILESCIEVNIRWSFPFFTDEIMRFLQSPLQ